MKNLEFGPLAGLSKFELCAIIAAMLAIAFLGWGALIALVLGFALGTMAPAILLEMAA